MRRALQSTTAVAPAEAAKASTKSFDQGSPAANNLLAYISDDEYTPNIHDKTQNLLILDDTSTKLEVLEMLEHFRDNLPRNKTTKAQL